MPQSDRKQVEMLCQSILQICAEKFDSPADLATFLGVPALELADWMDGKNLPPASVILKAVEPLVSGRSDRH